MIMNHDKIWIPSGKQTWRAGKWTIEIGDVPIKTSVYMGFSSKPCLIARGCQRVSYLGGCMNGCTSKCNGV